MAESNTPIVLVVCNDYGELALAMYLIHRQSFAEDTVLMLPPGLHSKNSDILPGRTFVYHSIDDIRIKLETNAPGILGLLSGYLMPIHRLCEPDELQSLLQITQETGWKCFSSDPFLGLLEDVNPNDLVTLTAPRWTIVWSIAAARERKRLSDLLGQMHRILNGVLHVYPCGDSPTESDSTHAKRLHFHNSAFRSQPVDEQPASTAAINPGPQKWLFVLGDQDYTVQLGKYGRLSRKFRKILLAKLHETLEAGRVPTLIAPTRVIEAVRKHSRAADAMELLGHCDYHKFQSLLVQSEYVFYWNAVSFSCILRTLSGKPWFTFDDGHLLRGMNTDYAKRIFAWFYQGGNPPRLDIECSLTCDRLLQETKQYLKSAWRIQQALLAAPDVPSVLSALLPENAKPESPASALEAFDILQQLGEAISSNELDGSFVVDSAHLAHPKNAIRSAVMVLLEQGTGEQVEFARSAAPTLAFFQRDVGKGRHAIDSPGPDGKLWRVAVEAEMLEITRRIMKQS